MRTVVARFAQKGWVAGRWQTASLPGLAAGAWLMFVAPTPQAWAHADVQSSKESTVPVLDAEGCVAVALEHSAKAMEARSQLAVYEARLEAVRANMYPKLTAMTMLAPAYTVRGNGFTEATVVRYRSIRDWGPFANFEARLVQPITTFGRLRSGEQAASERLEVEKQRVREVEQAVAKEVRRFYYTHLYVVSLQPALEQARAFVALAIGQAEALSKTGRGEVHQSDLGRLIHGQSELHRRVAEADEGEVLSLLALKQLMGLEADAPLQLADKRLPMPPRSSLGGPSSDTLKTSQETTVGALAPRQKGLDVQLQLARANRPQWQQLFHGQRAAIALERSERAAMLPRLLVVGQFAAAWTPTREHDHNPWHYDMFNRLAGGAALVLQLDLDVALARAKAREAAATGASLRALERLAETGIPLEVRQAYEGMRRAEQNIATSERDVVASRRWFTFAKAALQSGTGEARDLLEGLVAYLQAKEAHLAAALAWYSKLADLTQATGAATPPQLAAAAGLLP